MKDEILLVEKAQKGDSEAFGVLYDRYLPKIYRFVLLKVGGRKHDAEDLTHQAFAQAWEHINSFGFKGFPFSSWLYRIASNAVIDYYRTFKNHLDIEYAPREAVVQYPDFEGLHDDSVDMQFVKSAIAKLEPDQQNVVVMRFVDELSTREIAHALGKTEGAVRVIQHRALKQIKQHIDASRSNNTTQEA